MALGCPSSSFGHPNVCGVYPSCAVAVRDREARHNSVGPSHQELWITVVDVVEAAQHGSSSPRRIVGSAGGAGLLSGVLGSLQTHL